MLFLTTFAPVTANAQTAAVDNRALTIIVPFATGGTTDAMARLVAPEFLKATGRTGANPQLMV